MNRFRSLILPLAALLFMSACSTPTDLTAPTLEPQFGSAGSDYDFDVAYGKGGYLYVYGTQALDYDDGFVTEFQHILRRYDRNGIVQWKRTLSDQTCDYTHYYDICNVSVAEEVEVDGYGNAYTFDSLEQESCDAGMRITSGSVRKSDKAGNYVWAIHDIGSESSIAVDATGNLYVAGDNPRYEGEDCSGEQYNDPYLEFLSKYNSSGDLLWRRALSIGAPQDVGVSASGSVYVVGTQGLRRYSSSGDLTWSKSGGGDAAHLALTATHLYVRSGNTLKQYSASGSLKWSRTMSRLTTTTSADLAGDSKGNVYLVGQTTTSRGGRDPFVRKVNSTGTVVWTRGFGTSTYDDATGVATLDGSEIYVTGMTQGSFAHRNLGGSDGYLRKMNSSGSRVWTR